MNKPQILVVEDDTAVGNLITTTLETQNYLFHRAKTGAGALMDALSYRPDVILLDLGLPDMDGVTLIQKIRSWSNLPIIVISARSEDSDKVSALDAGADDMQAEEETFEIYTDPDAFGTVLAALEEKGYTFLQAAVEMVPQNYVKLESEEDIKNMEKLIDLLEENDDVQNVWHNWDQD